MRFKSRHNNAHVQLIIINVVVFSGAWPYVMVASNGNRNR
jgi:hypothetical protein